MQNILKNVRRNVPRYDEVTPKNQKRLLPILDEEKQALALLRLPRRLFELADAAQHPYQAFRLAQLAVAVEILLKAPLRISNLAGLDIKRHLILPRHLGGIARIVIDPSEVKNTYHLSYPLPEFTVSLLRRYLDGLRCTLEESGSTALFPGHLGRARNPEAFGKALSKAVFEHTGLAMNPHLFRHTMASLYLQIKPGDMETTRLVLGHKSIETTAKTYAFVDRNAALRRFWRVIQNHYDVGRP